jgi:hypothetical protein
MHPGPHSHADRAATTLADVDRIAAPRAGSAAPPGSGARDCRIDLKLLQWQAARACAASATARAHLARFDPAHRPDLWAGTVRDGTARGFLAALEEAVSLAPPPPDVPEPAPDGLHTREVRGRELRRSKDLLVASAGGRIRFTRRDGLLFVDRDERVHSVNCLRFEARADRGTLDGFAGAEHERPRLFSAQFLQPVRYLTAPGHARLDLAGRLGRGPVGWPMRLSLVGDHGAARVRLDLELDNHVRDWRLRARFLGIPGELLAHECTDVREVVTGDAGGFVAFTLVRACGTLLVDGAPVAVPGAQCQGALRHRFWLGAPATTGADGRLATANPPA